LPPDGEPNIHSRGLVAAIVASVVLGGTSAVGLGTPVLAAAPASTRVPAHLALLVAAIRGPAPAADVSSRLDGISVTATSWRRRLARRCCTDGRHRTYLGVLDELLPGARHVTEQYGNNRVEADHGRLKARLRPMRGLKRLATAAVITVGHAFVQNLRGGHYELTFDVSPPLRLAAAFTQFARII